MRLRSDKVIHTRDYFEGEGRVVIASSDEIQYSFEGDTRTGKGLNSVFTSAIIKGLKTGEADDNNDGLISYNELYNYAYEHVKEEISSTNPALKQTPKIWTFGIEGDVFIARNPHYTKKEQNVRTKPKNVRSPSIFQRFRIVDKRIILIPIILISVMSILFVVFNYILPSFG